MEKEVEKLNNEGVRLFLNGNFADAKVKYKKALEILPDYPATLNNMGMVFLQEKNFREAKKYFLSACNKKESPTYFLNLGHTYVNLQLPEKAEKYYLQSLDFDPESLMAWKSLATLYQYSGKYEKSVIIWNKIIQNFSDDLYYKIQLAKDLIALQEYRQALVVLSEAKGSGPYQELIWYYTALIHFKQRNFGLAESSIKKALSVAPDDGNIRILAATIYLGTSQLEKALFHYDKILTANNLNHKVRADKAVALLSGGFKKEALAELEKVISNDPKNVKALFYKAMTLMEMKIRHHEAQEILAMLTKGNHPFREKAAELLQKLNAESV